MKYISALENTKYKWTAVQVRRFWIEKFSVRTLRARPTDNISIQFHPEKAQFEFGKAAIHTSSTISLGQESANYFVNQCRFSSHRFNGDLDLLIYNYNPIYSGKHKKNPSFEQIYIFPWKFEWWNKKSSFRLLVSLVIWKQLISSYLCEILIDVTNGCVCNRSSSQKMIFSLFANRLKPR